MVEPSPADTNAGPLGLQVSAPLLEEHAFGRLWLAFMTARVAIAGALLLVHGVLFAIARSDVTRWAVLLCGAYLIATLLVRLLLAPQARGNQRRTQWRYTIAVDVLMYSALELIQVSNINYTPLFALPLLLSAVLGSLRLAIGTAAGITLLLLVYAGWSDWANPAGVTPQVFQAGLTGAAYFALALLVHQLSARLLREERKARESAAAALLQRQVADLVIDSLGDGVMVVDERSTVRVANPAALRLLGPGDLAPPPPFALDAEPGWSDLLALAQRTMGRRAEQAQETVVRHGDEPPRRLQVRSRLTESQGAVDEVLCVMFMEDLREVEARTRTEKLVSMGRMSTAVAHEIRNPLAAIAQANQLLSEDLPGAAQQRLTSIIGQNAQRLGKIVEEILDIASTRQQGMGELTWQVPLNLCISDLCDDWATQNGHGPRVRVLLRAAAVQVYFDADHLRRVLVNLLDNAIRYCAPTDTPIIVETSTSALGRNSLVIWSEGAPLEKTVAQHLFEPFFSSESRSSGLGLYICRELCERHQASIVYRRATREDAASQAITGNEFRVTFRTVSGAQGMAERRQTPRDA